MATAGESETIVVGAFVMYDQEWHCRVCDFKLETSSVTPTLKIPYENRPQCAVCKSNDCVTPYAYSVKRRRLLSRNGVPVSPYYLFLNSSHPGRGAITELQCTEAVQELTESTVADDTFQAIHDGVVPLASLAKLSESSVPDETFQSAHDRSLLQRA